MAEQAASQSNLVLLLPPQQEQQQSIPEHFLYKNRLQEFTQKANIPMPVYFTKHIGGLSQAPKFTSSVEVDGETYTTPNPFTNRKAAEQDAAKLALEGISKKIKNCVSQKTTEGGFPPIYEDKVFCKSILHEFANKMNIEKPEYDTVRSEGIVPVFISSLVFEGVKYVGQPSVNKKEAEQLAARAVILSILASEGKGMQLSEIIKSKAKLFSAVHDHITSNAYTDVSLQPNSGVVGKEDSEVTTQAGETGNVVALALPEQSGQKEEDAGQISNGIRSVVLEVSEQQSHVLPKHEFRKPAQEIFSEAVPLPIAFVPSVQQAESLEAPLHASACGEKRKRNRKKRSKKKTKTEIQ